MKVAVESDELDAMNAELATLRSRISQLEGALRMMVEAEDAVMESPAWSPGPTMILTPFAAARVVRLKAARAALSPESEGEG